MITWTLNLIGSLARIFTTLQEVNDVLILFGFIIGALTNAAIVAQVLLFWQNTTKVLAAKKEK